MPGSLVAAYSPSLKEWYRAYVMSSKSDQSSHAVFYVDFGNKEEVEKINVLPPGFDEPYVAVKLELIGEIDSKILESDAFQSISRRMVDAALFETRLRPDSLFIPDNQALFASVLQRQGIPIDYLLYARLTSGTTTRNSSSQRDYLLTLELTNIHTGFADKQSSEIRKGYHKTAMGKVWNYNPFTR